MKNLFCTYILIIADNNLEKLDRTIDSILKQSIDKELLRVLIIDNASQNEVYRDLLNYEIQNPQLISVIREKQPTTHGRLLKRLIQHLRFAQVGSSMILDPGDIIYPDFVKEARFMLQFRKVKCLIYEADIWEGDHIKKQKTIFTENCILSRLCRDVYYKYGIGHKVQVFYKGLPIDLHTKLPYYEVMGKHHNWLSLSFYAVCDNAYIKRAGGCIYEEACDFKRELIEWAFFIKRSLYAVETQVFSTKDAVDMQKEEIEAPYNCLAGMALQYALKNLKKGSFEEAEDALVFSEMMKLDIVESEKYIKLQQAIFDRTYSGELDILLECESDEPPRVCEQF